MESDGELKDLREQVSKAGIAALDQAGASCCYAKSDKYWIEDPQGIAWETFHTLASIPVFGQGDTAVSAKHTVGGCCVPAETPETKEQSGSAPVAAASAACCSR